MQSARAEEVQTRSLSMPLDQVPLPATLLGRFARVGIDVDDVLASAGLPRSRFEGVRPMGTTAELFAIWRAVREHGGPDAGIRLGLEKSYHEQSVASIAALHSATFGEGLAKIARYKRLVCPEEMTIEVTSREARVRFEWVLAKSSPPTLLIDAIFAGIMDLARQGTGASIAPTRLELSRRRADGTAVSRHFGCEIRFDAPSDVLALDPEALARPMLTHSPHVLAVLVPGLELALAQEGPRRTLLDDVRRVLGSRIVGERPAVEKIAKALGMSPRTLQRRLGEHGTSYQKVLDEVRHETARRLLASTDLATGEVAFLLGFEELNSFTRAFGQWEGTTPTRWRTAAR